MIDAVWRSIRNGGDNRETAALKWISATDLERWAATLAARSVFPAMIGDLIRASATDIQSFRFPSGDKGQVRGFDGRLVATGAPPYVPDGTSIWEFGVSKGEAKAESDYAKRLAEVDATERQNTTFVMASPCTWNDPKTKIDDWVAAKKARGEWKDVVLLDGSRLEDWLSNCPAVAAYYSRYELNCSPRLGARSVQEYWEEFSTRFRPDLVEDVLVSERDEQGQKLFQNFGLPSGDTVVSGDSPDEVVAFAVAAIRKAAPEIRLFLESRTLVIDTEEAARFLAGRTGYIFLPRGQARHLAGLLAKSSPTLIATGRDRSGRSQILLARQTARGLGKAIAAMGIPEDKAYEYARSCGRNLTCLSRLIPSVPGAAPPWVGDGRALIPALLAGAWDVNTDADKEVLQELGGRSYLEIEAGLRPLMRLDDAPIDREENIWKIRAPVDAFVQLGELIGADDLERFQRAATTVFSAVEDPPDPNELFRIGSRRSARHSSWLRDGLATTLLLIAVYGGQANLVVPGQSAQGFVDALIRRLPGLANDHRLIASLSKELPLLMEAAPDPLLSALEHLLEGDGSAIRPIFTEVEQFLTPSSSHTGLLWALEILAWDPERLNRVARVLAGLAAIDPGGRLGNRPIESLREIFVTWGPQTNATLVQRLAVLDNLISDFPSIAWELLVKLLPKPHDSISPTERPRLREAGSSESERLTYAIVWQGQHGIVERALNLAGNIGERWVAIVECLGSFDPPSRSRALRFLDNFLGGATGDAKLQVWSSLRDETNRNLAFADAEWALSGEELSKLQMLVKKHEPSDVLAQVSWLFDDWSPRIPGNLEDRQETIEQNRRDAIGRIVKERGLVGVAQLAAQVELPQFVASSFVEAVNDLSACEAMLVHAVDNREHVDAFAITLSGATAHLFGRLWLERFRLLSEHSAWSTEITAALCLGWPDNLETWRFVGELGEAVERSYWTRKTPWLIRGDLTELHEAAERYLRFGRPVAALDAIFNRARELPSDLLLNLLDAAVLELNKSDINPNTMFLHHLEVVLEVLEARPELSRLDIAKREYAYLPLLQRRNRTLSIHRVMADDPDFYVSIIVDAFKPAKQADVSSPPSDEVRARGRAAFRLLSSFKLVPGQNSDGDIDLEVLREWVGQVRAKAQQVDRAVIADQYVGQVLAHSPNDPTDSAWPVKAVRKLIDELNSEEVERGVHIERVNMRGVYSKAMYEGGKQERALAAQTQEWGRRAAAYPRTSALLKRIAEDWTTQAEREDVRARQDLMRSE